MSLLAKYDENKHTLMKRVHYGPEATPTKKKVLEDPKAVLIPP